MRKKPTHVTCSLWNVTGALSVTAHADEPHKAISLVDFTVTIGDTETAHDFVNNICKVLQWDENVHDFLRHLVILQPEKLKRMAREWRAEEHMAEAAALAVKQLRRN